MDESTAIEQPAPDSIADDLAAAMAEHDEPETVEDVDEVVSETDEEEEIEASDDATEEEVDSETKETSQVTAPEHWSAADKDLFSSAPPELKQWLLDRHKSMEGDYTRKNQEVSEIKRTWEPVQEIFAPHMESLRAQGLTPASLIGRWSQIDQQLTENPQQTIQWLAGQYGVNMGQAEGGDSVYIDPQVQSLTEQVSNLQNSIAQREQQEAAQRTNSVAHDIQSFSEKTTEAGELAHPYFDEVVDDMVAMAKAVQSTGKTPTVGDLYEKAVWANPGTREKLQAVQRQAAAKESEKVAKAKAAKAKNATKTIRASADGVSSSDLSLRDQLTQAFN